MTENRLAERPAQRTILKMRTRTSCPDTVNRREWQGYARI
nr:MAG TPA: hypothetical protein [Caudoviricetes sp.]